MHENVSGVIEHIIFRNKENGYTVFTLRADGEELTCVGFFADIQEGSGIDAGGTYTEHFSYGTQFRIESYTIREPESAEAIETYLASGAVKGIGKVLAGRIVKHFGEDALRIMEEEPERLQEIKGSSPGKAREIGARTAEQAGMRRAMMFLEGYGITLKMSIRIYKEYGEDIYTILKENPYRMAEDIDGIGFLTADRIAARAGIEAESEYRLRSGILYVLSLAGSEGNVYLPEDELLMRALFALLLSGAECGEKASGSVRIHERLGGSSGREGRPAVRFKRNHSGGRTEESGDSFCRERGDDSYRRTGNGQDHDDQRDDPVFPLRARFRAARRSDRPRGKADDGDHRV